MVPTLVVISMLIFGVIQLPPGDYVTYLVAQISQQTGKSVQELEVTMRERYGLNESIPVQYVKWISNIITKGDFGYSFYYARPAAEVITERIPLTFAISLMSLLLVWIVSLPIGIYSAIKQYSLADYVVSAVGFIGLAVPGFLLALVLMYLTFRYLGQSVTGLFSPEYRNAPWDAGKVIDLLKHMWIPILITAFSGTAGLIRVMRANLLDELHKPYVETARSKGLPERRLMLKYPVRHALNPFVSTIGWALPGLISGGAIIEIVLNLPTTGPVLLQALRQQDMYLAAGFLLVLSVLTVIGTLISDLLLVWLDPRIRYE
jgi:peptide/nickel transport system permease protein